MWGDSHRVMRLAASGMLRARASLTLVYDRRFVAFQVYSEFGSACVDRARQRYELRHMPNEDI
eukprot:2907952-Pyramimonas_sp.AAC.1